MTTLPVLTFPTLHFVMLRRSEYYREDLSVKHKYIYISISNAQQNRIMRKYAEIFYNNK